MSQYGIKIIFDLDVASEIYNEALLNDIRELNNTWFIPLLLPSYNSSELDIRCLNILNNLLMQHSEYLKINQAMALELKNRDKLTKGYCMYPNCKSKAILSHNTPKSWLNQIEESGNVLATYMGVSRIYTGVQPLENIGQAGAHYTFCNEHDTKLFLNMENGLSSLSEKVVYECIHKSLYSKRAHLIKAIKNQNIKIKNIFNKYLSKKGKVLIKNIDINIPETYFIDIYDKALNRVKLKENIVFITVESEHIDMVSNICIPIEEELWLFGGAVPIKDRLVHWVAFFKEDLNKITYIKTQDEILNWLEGIPQDKILEFVLPLLFQDEDTFIKPKEYIFEKYGIYIVQAELNLLQGNTNEYVLSFIRQFGYKTKDGSIDTPTYKYVPAKKLFLEK